MADQGRQLLEMASDAEEAARLRVKGAAMAIALGRLCAAMEGLRPFPLVVDAVAVSLIKDGRDAIAQWHTEDPR